MAVNRFKPDVYFEPVKPGLSTGYSTFGLLVDNDRFIAQYAMRTNKGGKSLGYEETFLKVRNRVISDLGENFVKQTLLQDLKLSIDQAPLRPSFNDRYTAHSIKAPAYYNPNTHTVHVNPNVLKRVKTALLENIYYHELTHAASHHARIEFNDRPALKSGLKIQSWDANNQPTTLHRGLNEGFTQYLANTHTSTGPAYRREVEVIGLLIRKIGLNPLKTAYFSPAIDQLDRVMNATFGDNALNKLSSALDDKEYSLALQRIV